MNKMLSLPLIILGLLMLPTTDFSAEKTQVERVEAVGYRFVDQPGKLSLKIPTLDFLKKGDAGAILIDDESDTDADFYYWESISGGSIKPIRILFDLGSDSELTCICLFRGRHFSDKKGKALIRLLGMSGDDKSGELSVFKAVVWDQAEKNELVLETGLSVCRYVELEIYLFRESGGFQISEVSFTGIKLQSGAETSLSLRDRPWVDCYGQYKRERWNSKIYSDAEIRELGKKDLLSNSKLPELPYPHDRYGGLDGTGKAFGLTGTGFFRVQKVNGKWWFITPEGNLFFALGMDGVLVKGRSMFMDKYSDAYTNSCTMKEESYYFNNVKTKYGKSFLEDWLRVSLFRVRSWNFNTLGKWSNEIAWHKGKSVLPIPYTFVLRLDKFVPMIPNRGSGNPVPDVFSQDITKKVRNAVEAQINEKGSRNDPWLLGYMVSNEEPFNWRLVRDILALDGRNWPVKRRFVDWFNEKYGAGWRKAAKRWGVLAHSPQELLSPVNLKKRPSNRVKKEMESFVGLMAGRYFEIVSQELRRADPNHLYLGNSMGGNCEESWRAYGRFVDVASIDNYSPVLNSKLFDRLAGWIDRPILVAEHGLTAAGRGLSGWGRVFANGTERAEIYAKYIKDLASYPYMVGNFYYIYRDHEIAGKDGHFLKNWAFGFVDVTDQVDQAMARAAREVHGMIYEIRKP